MLVCGWLLLTGRSEAAEFVVTGSGYYLVLREHRAMVVLEDLLTVGFILYPYSRLDLRAIWQESCDFIAPISPQEYQQCLLKRHAVGDHSLLAQVRQLQQAVEIIRLDYQARGNAKIPLRCLVQVLNG